MKRTLSILLALVMVLVVASAAFAEDVKTLAAAGEKMSREELIEKAKAEEGTFIVYGNTSRIINALEKFCEMYAIKGEGNNLKDGEIYTKLESEFKAKAKGADMVMIQDGASLQALALDTGLLVNFVPMSISDKIDEADKNPLKHQYTNKLFIWNKLGDDVPAVKNVWELTEEKYKGNIIFKNPEAEQVNMNFLVMLTSPQWAEKLALAYKNLYGKEIELGSYPNAGYKWIAEFLGNCSFGKSDTSIAEEVSKEEAKGKLGLFVLSKLRSSSVHAENLAVGQYLASESGTEMEPFSGFMYPIYAMLTANAKRPYTAMLFVDYLMQADGFAPWGKSIGAYSTNHSVSVKEGDLNLSVWKKTLVTEDIDYILENGAKVSDFIIKHLQ